MSRRRAISQEQDLLSQKSKPAAVPVPPAPSGPPRLLQYSPFASTEKWQVEKYENLAAEFGFSHYTEFEMATFHETAAGYTRQWLICRRLFGIGPVIPSAETNPEDIGAKPRQAICESLGIDLKSLQAELDSLRVLWRNTTKEEKRNGESKSGPLATASHRNGDELEFGDDILRDFGFSEQMFQVTLPNPGAKEGEPKEVPRAAEENRLEKLWFAKRVHEWARILNEPMVGGLAREALYNELYLRRFGQAMTTMDPSSEKWRKLFESKKQIEAMLGEQLEQLQNAFPEASSFSRESFRQVMSSCIRAQQEFYARADNTLADGINRACEIEVMMRMSEQAPEPKYRLGLNTYLLEAVHNLYDPDFRSQFNHRVWKLLDAGLKEAVMRSREANNIPLVDLEDGVLPGEGSNFDDLKPPTENEDEKG